MITRKSKQEIAHMREAGWIIAETFEKLAALIEPGITTEELDAVAERNILERGAKPAFKGLYGFPATLCVAVNEQVVHGIPGKRKLQDGDIISIDMGAEINSYFGDSARTFCVGEPESETQRLVRVTKEALYKGIDQAYAGIRLTNISHAVQNHVEKHGFSIVRDYVGHGIGTAMHEDPQIPNFGPPGRGPRLEAGTTLAIEPMVNMGTYKVKTLDDQWTVVTEDGKPSAHFEHTILITEGRPEILTAL